MILCYRTDDSPLVKAGVPLLKELVALSGLAQGNRRSLLDDTNALPSVLLCLCPDVTSWKIFPILSKYPILTPKLYITTKIHHSVFSAQTPTKVCFFSHPLLMEYTCSSLLLTSQLPLRRLFYVSLYWCLPCARHCVKCFPCIISFKSLNNPESYMLLSSPFFI